MFVETKPAGESITRERTWRDVLRDAANLLECEGWGQGDLESQSDGRTYYCSVGAIQKVAGVVNDRAYSLSPAGFTALAKMESWLGEGRSFISWNDAPGRTAAEVIAAFRTVANESE